tara:strand:- start:849 stop:2900 length:2052 start_codon:yes stop_codon:yes gene_type:complete
MKSYKVGTVQINNSFSGQNYLPLSIGFLVSYARFHCKNIEEYEFLNPIYKRIKIKKAVELYKECDIVAFSVYVWNNNISMEIAKALKKINPEILILAGGCHIPENPNYIKKYMDDHPYVDIASIGEGERVFTSFLENYPQKTWKNVESLIYRNGGDLVTTPQAERIKDMNEIPSPFIEGYFDQLIRDNPDERWIGLWETNRGCPFACTFCDWGVGFKKKVSKYDLDGRLFEEINWFSKNKIEFIFTCDANFGMYKDRDLPIVEKFAENKAKYGYPEALSVQNTKNSNMVSYQIQKILADSGLSKGALIAFQSLDFKTLKAIKRANIKLSVFFELQAQFMKDGIKTFSDIILGLPEETYESFTDGVGKLVSLGQHNRIQFNNLSILPNTEMGDPEYLKKYEMEVVENKIINIHGAMGEWLDDIYETQQMVVGTKSMPGEEWVKTRVFGYVVAFLHFNKLFQIPIIIANSIYKINYTDIFKAFVTEKKTKTGSFSDLIKVFYDHARNMQKGGPEFVSSKKWLNIWWPPDELAFIKAVTENRLEDFYVDAKEILFQLFEEKTSFIKEDYAKVISEAISLNKSLIKIPNQTDDLHVNLNFNILDIYVQTLMGKESDLREGKFRCHIDRTSETWNSWEEWCEKVVWWSNKKGAYLYNFSITKSKNPKNNSLQLVEIESEPFGNDARYQ